MILFEGGDMRGDGVEYLNTHQQDGNKLFFMSTFL